jgi:GMP synthase (glutamine-hydrolysing)
LSKGIVVIDFGGQYAHLIANRIRRLDVYAEILPPDTSVENLEAAAGIVLSGGPSSVYAADRPPFNEEIVTQAAVPILGLCYGHQLLCHLLGGHVEAGETMEYGAATLHVREAKGVLAGLKGTERIWMSHRDTAVSLPAGFEILGETEDCPIAVMGNEERRIYGMQLHPEVTHTASGMHMLENFVGICGCERTWTMENFIDQSMQQIKQRVGSKKVFLFVSGGVDSTVCFVLLNNALGKERVQGLHIDNGFMRKDETAAVEQLLRSSGFDNLNVVDASEEFLAAVAGVADPERKRVLIGEAFVNVRDRVLDEMNLDPEEWLLGQGTLYTDTIESGGTDHAEVIKTHHNRVNVIEQLLSAGKVIEPLSQLYKDEVRKLGEKLGLSHELVWRHPFPGPGLAVRALCLDGSSRGNGSLAQADVTAARVLEAAQKEGVQTAGLTAHVLPLRSVGVQGDGRTYAHPIVVRDASSSSGTGLRPASDPGELSVTWEALERLSTELTNAIVEVNRVVFQLGPDHGLDQRLKEGYLTRERLDVLREADAIAMDELERHGLMGLVTQMPTVLLPLSTDGVQESVVLRPISTDDFMTASVTQLPSSFLDDVTRRLLAVEGIEAVYYDITHKPPGTVEWE